MPSGFHSGEVPSTRADNFIVAMVTDLWHHLIYNLRGAWHTVLPYSSQIINEMLDEIHTMEKCDFLNPIIDSICYI